MKSRKVQKRTDGPERSPGRLKAAARRIANANKGKKSAQDQGGVSSKRIRPLHNDTEQGLREAKDHLELRIRERTAELEQANRSLQEEVAERKRAEEAVYRAKEDWERTFDTVPDLVAILDEQHRIVRVNRSMADRNRRRRPCATAKPASSSCQKPPAACCRRPIREESSRTSAGT